MELIKDKQLKVLLTILTILNDLVASEDNFMDNLLFEFLSSYISSSLSKSAWPSCISKLAERISFETSNTFVILLERS